MNGRKGNSSVMENAVENYRMRGGEGGGEEGREREKQVRISIPA